MKGARRAREEARRAHLQRQPAAPSATTPLSNNDKLLIIIACCGDESTRRILSEGGTDLDVESHVDYVHAVTVAGHVDYLKLIAEHGADLNKKFSNPESFRGKAPIHIACAEGRVEFLKVLIDRNVEMNEWDDECQTPAYIATARGHVNCLELLAEYGADLNKPDAITRNNPIHIACLNGRVECLEVLMVRKYNVEFNQWDGAGFTPAHIAASRGDLICLDVLARLGADLDKRTPLDKGGYAPIHEACREGTANCVAFLLSKVHVNSVTGEEDLTGVYIACKVGSVHLLDLFIEYGADLTYPNVWGYTPLHVASKYGQVDIMSLLIQNHVDVYARNNTTGETPMHFARKSRNKRAIKLLTEHGWQDAPKCMLCETEFSWFLWKHHCRQCGRYVYRHKKWTTLPFLSHLLLFSPSHLLTSPPLPSSLLPLGWHARTVLHSGSSSPSSS